MMASAFKKAVDRCKTSFGYAGQTFRQFCENTSIHGLKYIVEEGSHWIERVAWFLVFVAGVCFSSYFCWQMWRKWEESPVLISLDSTRYPLSNIAFPAVTICNVNKVSRKRLLKVLSQTKYANVSYDIMQNTLRYMTKLDRAILNEKELNALSAFYGARNISATDLFDILKQTAPSCRDLVMDCVWLGLPNPCMEYVSFLPTDDGICCTFNGGSYNDSELGIQSKGHETLKVSGNGYRMGLALVMDVGVDDYSVTNGKFDGFKVLVHSPEQFPDVSDRGFVMAPGTETFVGVKGIATQASDDVAKVPAEKRGCLVEGEWKLEFFSNYSRSACQVECATKLMQERCKCRPYFFRADKGTPLCDLSSYSCISDVYEEIRQFGDAVCGCLAPCTDVWYEPEISAGSFPGRGFNLTRTFRRLVDQLNLSSEVNTVDYFRSNVAVLHVFYKDKTGLLYKTDVRFGIEDFISAMGGLLGLGLGLSFISVIELIYYLCLRCHCHSKFAKSNKPNGPTQWPSTSTGMASTFSIPHLSNQPTHWNTRF